MAAGKVGGVSDAPTQVCEVVGCCPFCFCVLGHWQGFWPAAVGACTQQGDGCNTGCNKAQGDAQSKAQNKAQALPP